MHGEKADIRFAMTNKDGGEHVKGYRKQISEQIKNFNIGGMGWVWNGLRFKATLTY